MKIHYLIAKKCMQVTQWNVKYIANINTKGSLVTFKAEL